MLEMQAPQCLSILLNYKLRTQALGSGILGDSEMTESENN